MKKKIFLIFLLTAILIPNDNLKDKIVVEYSDETSSFIYNDIEYKIVLDATLYHNEYYVDNKLFIEYIVYKDDVEIYSNDESNYIYADCDYEKGGPFKYHYEIDFIQKDKSFVTINDNYGWIIYTGGICGNTFSYQSDIIISPLESGNEIITSNQLFKTKPNIIIENNKIDIYYSFQEWNFAGTRWSEFIPQKLTYDISKHKLLDSKIKIKDLVNLKFNFNLDFNLDLSKNFTSLFMSGFNDLNLNLMQYAIDNLYNPKHVEEWYSYFYGSNFEYQREMFNFKDKSTRDMFVWGMITHYGHKNMKWLYEFFTINNDFNYHENEVINHKYKYLRLADCSKNSFQRIVNKLRW